MPVQRRPIVFVSSTCYDLGQIRRDLRDFIEGLGLEPMLSDFSAFPVDPSIGAVENCLAAVKSRVDIFVLVVGGRYGSETDSGKSITNLEYLEAKAKGIPCYVFVRRDVLTALPLWRDNHGADFGSLVQSPKVFEFVETLRDPAENWVFGFDSAEDITRTLQDQLAFLFQASLDLRTAVTGSGLSAAVQDLPAAALMLIIRKPKAWEFLLLAELLSHEIEQGGSLRRDLRFRINLEGTVDLKDPSTCLPWLMNKLSEIQRLGASVGRLVNEALPVAMGGPGKSADIEFVMYVTRRIGDAYRKLIEWSLDFARVASDPAIERPLEAIALMSDNFISTVESAPDLMRSQTMAAIERRDQTLEPVEFEVELKLTMPDVAAEFDAVMEWVKSGR